MTKTHNRIHKQYRKHLRMRGAAAVMTVSLCSACLTPAAAWAEEGGIYESSLSYVDASYADGYSEDYYGEYYGEEYVDWTEGFADSVMEMLYNGELLLGDDGLLYTLDLAWWVDPYTGEFFPVETYSEPEPTEEPGPTQDPIPTEEPVPTQDPIPTEEPVPTAEPSPTAEPVPTEEPAPTEEPEKTDEEEKDLTEIVDPEINEDELALIPAEGSNEELLQSVQLVHAPEIRKDFRFTTVSQSPFWALHNCFVYEGQTENSRRVGALPRNGICYLLEAANSEWYYVESGDVRGYIQPDKLTPYPPAAEESEPVSLTLAPVQENAASSAASDTVREAGNAAGQIRIPDPGDEAVPEGPVVFRNTEAEEQKNEADPAVIRDEAEGEQKVSGGPAVFRDVEAESRRDLAGIPAEEKQALKTPRTEALAEKVGSPAAAEEKPADQNAKTADHDTAVAVKSALDSASQEWTDREWEDAAASAYGEDTEALPEIVQEETALFSEDGYALATCYIEPWENAAYTAVHKTVQQTVVPKDYALALQGWTAIRENRSDEARIIGLLPERGLCCVLADKEEEWVYVESGDVRGFVRREQLDLPQGGMTDYILSAGEQSFALAEEQIPPEENGALYYTFTSTSEPHQGSYIRESMMEFAAQFLGNPYVWGGNSLTNGVDCSGFVREIYLCYGYDLPRVAEAQAYVGMQIPVDEAQPGDLIFYAQNGYIYHVVMSTGNGGTIEAMGAAQGIVYSYVNEADAVWATRILED